MTCFWNNEGTCRHPRIGNTPASEERCGSCDQIKIIPVTAVSVPSRRDPVPEPVPVHHKSLLEKAASWVKAEVSMVTQGPLDDERYQKRIDACLACPKLQRSEEPGKVGWCKACGCGQNVRAELTVKARMPKATCPVNAWDKGDTQER